jgi:hypothetical protein
MNDATSSAYQSPLFSFPETDQDGFSALQDSVEGGFIDLRIDSVTLSGTSSVITDDSITNPSTDDATSDRTGRSLFLEMSEEGSTCDGDLTAGGYAYTNNSSYVVTATLGSQDAICPNDGNSGGMITLPPVTDRSDTGSIAAGPSALVPHGLLASMPVRNIEIDKGIGRFQAFELASAPLERAPYGTSSSQELDESDTAVETTASVSSSDVPLIVSRSMGRNVLYAADTSTMVIVSLITAVVQNSRLMGMSLAEPSLVTASASGS